jgi:hypothetical protein
MVRRNGVPVSDILSNTYEGGAAVTQSDTVNDPAGPFAALWIGTAGSGALKVTMVNGDVVTLAGVAASGSSPLRLAVLRVWSTGTGVSNVVGLKANPFMGSKWA